MPSPIGHGLAALAVGWAVAGREQPAARTLTQAAIFVAIGVAPDLDLLVGRHSAETHSVGAAAIVASIAAWRRWPIASTAGRIWLAAFLAWVSHPVLDSLGRDGTPPLGVMLWWPFSSAYVLGPWRVFEAISRRYWLDEFLWHNIRAVVREVVILLPLTALAFVAARRQGRRQKLEVRSEK